MCFFYEHWLPVLVEQKDTFYDKILLVNSSINPEECVHGVLSTCKIKLNLPEKEFHSIGCRMPKPNLKQQTEREPKFNRFLIFPSKDKVWAD